MHTKATAFKAKPVAIKVAVIENQMTFVKLAEETNSAYATIVNIAAGTQNTTKLRAHIIADALGKNVEDLFTEVN